MFNRIVLEDSTVISLNNKLAFAFRGCGGSARKSALKLNLIYDLTQGLLIRKI